MTRALRHITSDGERWDHLADRYYGDPYGYVRICEANPFVPLYPVFPAGVLLAIPVIDAAPAQLADLPPWKRGTA